MANRSSWRQADVALAWLVALATLAIGLALTLSETGWESALALVVTVCRRTLAETLAHGAELGRLSLLFPLGLGLLLAAGEALHLVLSTGRWVTSLTFAQSTPPNRLRRLAHKCGLDRNIVLVRADRPLVFTHGLFHSKVWLSTGLIAMLTDDELESVLRHEAHHVKARDPLKILAARCLSRALFVIPLARDLCEAYLVSKEIAADEDATRTMADALPLARALRKLLRVQAIPVPETVLVGKLDITEARLLILLDPDRPVPLSTPKHLGVSLLLLMIFLAVALAPVAGHNPSFTECAIPTAMSPIVWQMPRL